MDAKLIKEILRRKEEADRFEFKQELHIYDSIGKIITSERDEFIKDILGLANGNSTIIKKSKFLIIGVDNNKFDESGKRLIHNVNYQVPKQNEITQWVNGSCNPSIVGIACEYYSVEEKNIYIITIPPTFDLHETTRDLEAKGKFHKYTVFMRQDEHTVIASVRDGITIQQLKFVYRSEIYNPPAKIFGAIIGVIFAIVFWNAGYNSARVISTIPNEIKEIALIISGAIIGGYFGWLFQQGNEFIYKWKYSSTRGRIILLIGLLIMIIFVIGYVYLSIK